MGEVSVDLLRKRKDTTTYFFLDSGLHLYDGNFGSHSGECYVLDTFYIKADFV